ncbi:MAG: hypothetical protein LPL29_03890 [Alphaproteobacteria bacterium]|nr:hypothetical protein [Alphaproteobacteria bacterium]
MTTIIVDGNNVGIAAAFTHPTLTDPYGRPSGAIYGFLRAVKPMIDRASSEAEDNVRVIVAWDSSKSWRREILDTYKESRRKSKEDEPNEVLESYFEQKPRLIPMLRMLGVGQISAEGYEADDIAGWMPRHIPGRSYYMVSNDADWLQLVAPERSVWQPTRQRLVTTANFTDVTGCDDAQMFLRMKAIIGDKGDDVPGAVGIGEGFALKYLRGDLKKGKKFDTIKAWEEDENGYARSLKLVDLHSVDIPMETLRIIPGEFDRSAFMDKCIELGFNSILSNLSAWTRPFEAAA